LGTRIASLLGKGSIVALEGPLGAGKTCLAKGIAKGLCIPEEVTSPSYTIVSEYEAIISGEKITMYHIDAYRLRNDDDFIAIGGEDMVYGEGISVIEWSDRILSFIPDGALKVDIAISTDTERKIHIYRKNNLPSFKDCT